MNNTNPPETSAIKLAEQILFLLENGSFTATYKYAVLLAMLDLSMEKSSKDGNAPDVITTEEMAKKVVQLYWPHAVPYGRSAQSVLRQNTNGQAEIVRKIEAFRERTQMLGIVQARSADKKSFERLERFVEYKLIEMPLPRLQRVGKKQLPILYKWNESVADTDVKAYINGERNAFDNRLLLQPGVGQALVQLNGILRPFIHREWARLVACINGLEAAMLEDFLFVSEREPLTPVRRPLLEMQNGECFYCQSKMREAGEVDHFVPFSRYPDNGIANLVIAHKKCNSKKRHFLADADHVQHWLTRNYPRGGEFSNELKTIASTTRIGDDDRVTTNVARSIYFGLPADVHLWVEGDVFRQAEAGRIRHAFRAIG